MTLLDVVVAVVLVSLGFCLCERLARAVEKDL